MQEFTPNNTEPLVADINKKEELMAAWPYVDFEFEEWVANGSLLTEKGIPSRLGLKEYNLVRTPEFKNWFGDWANREDDKVSDIVDPVSGEPALWYRGDHSYFRANYIVRPDDLRGDAGEVEGGDSQHPQRQGVFFSNDINTSKSFALGDSSLGKYALDPKSDHQRTFEGLISHIVSIADTDPYFWNKTIDASFHREAIGDVVYKERFFNYFQRFFSEEDAKSLWDEVMYNRRSKPPKYFLDILSKNHSALADVVLNPLKSQFWRKSEGFNFTPIEKEHYGSNFMHSRQDRTPVHLKLLRELIIKYQADPACLKKVFIKSFHTKIDRVAMNSRDVFNARVDGYDAYLNRGGAIGDGVTDEIIVFDPDNVWVADTVDLSEEYLKSNL